jgi:dTMP kinase
MRSTDPSASQTAEIFTLSFTALLVGQVVSILGDRLGNIALVELLAQETGKFAEAGSAFELSKLALAMVIPSLVLGPFAGAYIDRVSRKRVLVVTDLFRAGAVLAIPFLRPAFPLWTVYCVVALLYVANVFFLPARCAVVSEIVRKGLLIRSNSILSLGATAATIAGFAAGGVLAARAGWRTALYVDSATYLFSAGALSLISIPGATRPQPGSRPVSYVRIIREAWGELNRSATVRAAVLVPPVMVLGGTAAYVLGIPLLERAYPEGTIQVGLVVGLAGAGMALGCIFTGRMLAGADRRRTIGIAAVLSILPLAAIALTENLCLVSLAALAAGFAAGPVFVTSETAVQEKAATRRQATVFAFRDMQLKIAMAAAAWLAAAVAAVVGTPGALVALLVAAAVLVLPAVRLGPRD